MDKSLIIHSFKTKREKRWGFGLDEAGQAEMALPDPVALKTEEQPLEREQNERYVLDAVGDYKCHAGQAETANLSR
jgi:hypothetical protein